MAGNLEERSSVRMRNVTEARHGLKLGVEFVPESTKLEESYDSGTTQRRKTGLPPVCML